MDHFRDSITHNLDRAYESQVIYYNNKHSDGSFRVGDLILKRQRILSKKVDDVAAKLSEKFEGPYKICKKL